MPHVRERLLVAAAALGLLAVAASATSSALTWIGKPFPGVLVLGNRVVASAGLGHWPATVGGEIYQHEILSVDGEPLNAVADLHARVASAPLGTPLTYRLRRGDREFTRTIPTRRFERGDFWLLFGGYLFNGLVLGATALAVLVLRGRDWLARATVPLLWLSALWCLSALDLYGPHRLFRIHAFCGALMPAAALHMAIGFPEPLRWAAGRPWLLAVPYALALTLALASQRVLMEPAGFVALHRISITAFGLALLVLIASQVVRTRARVSFESQQRIKLLALGAAAALAPPVVITLASGLTGGRAPQNVIASTVFLLPLALGYAALRDNLSGVDVFVRRALTYTALTGCVALLYLAVGAGFEALLPGSPVRESGWFALAFAGICVALLVPLRRALAIVLDRLFFRTTYDFRRTVEQVSLRLASVASLEEVAAELTHAVEQTLHPESISLHVEGSQTLGLEAVGPAAASPEISEALALAQDAAGPFDLENEGLGIPLRNEGGMVGVLLLGGRASGRPYGGDDRRLLQTLAHQGAVAVRNAAALERLRDLNRDLEAKVGERTCELSDALRKLHEKNATLAELSTIDHVTGLRTRHYIMERLSAEIARSRRHGSGLAVIMMDLDHFKRVNDTYGHLAGDQVLREVGRLIRSNLRATDVAARYGGEELLVAVVENSNESATFFTERLRQAVEALRFQTTDGREFNVTASFGVALFQRSHETPEDIVADADAALYRAKDEGRNSVVTVPADSHP